MQSTGAGYAMGRSIWASRLDSDGGNDACQTRNTQIGEGSLFQTNLRPSCPATGAEPHSTSTRMGNPAVRGLSYAGKTQQGTCLIHTRSRIPRRSRRVKSSSSSVDWPVRHLERAVSPSSLHYTSRTSPFRRPACSAWPSDIDYLRQRRTAEGL